MEGTDVSVLGGFPAGGGMEDSLPHPGRVPKSSDPAGTLEGGSAGATLGK
jgi:hypothetical protein